MSFTRHFVTLALILTVVSAIEDIGKRSIFERQSCPTPGWVPDCPGAFQCVPPGAICCNDGFTYVLPPRSCPDGTEPLTTARTGSALPSTITTPPASTEIVGSLTYFTYEITWYYWYYYFTYVAGATATYSYEITSTTLVSVQATNTAQADVLFTSLKATLSLPTPTQTATSFSGSVPSATASAPTKPSSNGTTPAATTSAVQFTGAGTTLMARPMAHWAELVMGALFIVPGLLMVWL